MVIVRRYGFDLQPGMLIPEDDGDTFRIGGITTEGEQLEIMAVSTMTGQFAIFRAERMEFVKTVEQ